jgi:hypothetical protein
MIPKNSLFTHVKLLNWKGFPWFSLNAEVKTFTVEAGFLYRVVFENLRKLATKLNDFEDNIKKFILTNFFEKISIH